MNRPNAPIRVVIVDDHASFAQTLRLYFEHRALDIRVEAIAHSARDGVKAVLATQPHVVIMDLLLPDGSGIDAALEIRRRTRLIRVLIVTSEDDPATMNLALNAGIQGYLVKSVNADAILEAVRAVHRRELVFDDRARNTIVELAEGPIVPDRTEIEILRLAARGTTTKAMAEEMNMSERTVTRRLGSAYAKLGVTNRPAAITEAKRRSLI